MNPIRSLLLRAAGALSRPRRGEGLLYYSQTDRALHLVDDAGTDTALGAGGGGSGAPTTADYLVKTADAGLSAERVVTNTSWISVDWGTAGQAKFNLADAGLVSLASADAAAGLPYVSAANTWASLSPGTRGDRLTQGTSAPEWSGPTGFWGDGSDGAVNLDGTNTYAGFTSTTGAAPNLVYTLTRDVQATSLIIASGKTLKTAGFQVYVQGTFSGAGTLEMIGSAASGTTGGSGWTNVGSLNVGASAGANGRSTDLAGIAGTSQSNCAGGSGGAGGASGLGRAGGNGGTANAPAADRGAWKQNIGWSLNNCRFIAGIGLNQPVGGAGGGSGGCSPSTGTANSGAGGGPAGIVQVWARYITFTGSISAKGGAGANATFTGAGQAGGGGGGGGGHVRVHTTTPTASYTVDVSGGAKGTGANGGSDGVDGSAGSSVHIVI